MIQLPRRLRCHRTSLPIVLLIVVALVAKSWSHMPRVTRMELRAAGMSIVDAMGLIAGGTGSEIAVEGDLRDRHLWIDARGMPVEEVLRLVATNEGGEWQPAGDRTHRLVLRPVGPEPHLPAKFDAP